MDVDFGRVINKNQLLGWRWAPLCDAVRRSPVLSDGAKILYNEIVSFMWQKDDIRAWPSQRTLGDNLSISRQAVSRRFKELEAVGLVGVKRNGLGKSSDIYLYDLDLLRLQVGQDDTGAFRPISQLDAASDITESAPEVNSTEPVIPPDVTLSLHQDVTQPLHQDVTQGLHQDVTPAPRDADVAEASGSDVADVPAIGVSAEEETGEIINREEEASAPQSDFPTTSGKAKPELSIIHRRDIPQGNCVTWNFAMTEESVVIDGERFIVLGDEHAVEGVEVERSLEPELPDPETVEAETSDEDTIVNQGKMAKLVSGVGGDLTTEADGPDGDVAPPKMSREEMRAKLQKMDWRAGIDVAPDDEV